MRKILELPKIYEFFQKSIGATRARQYYVEHIVRPQKGFNILDIGCGPAEILKYFTNVNYYGYDLSERYIEMARRTFGDKGLFFCESIDDMSMTKENFFDIVIMNGVLHHLTDEEVNKSAKIAQKALKKDGRFITIDGCFTENQSCVSRLLLNLDRGQYVRRRDEYKSLVEEYFSTTRVFLKHDLLYVPYTHLIMECVK